MKLIIWFDDDVGNVIIQVFSYCRYMIIKQSIVDKKKWPDDGPVGNVRGFPQSVSSIAQKHKC